jgi:nitroreductase
MPESSSQFALDGYHAFMEVVSKRITTRNFRRDYAVPRSHYELIVEAARHSPSAANAQPWHFVAVTEPSLKQQISEVYLAEQSRRVAIGMRFPQVAYDTIATAPGLIVAAADLRFSRVFPVPRPEDGDSDENAPYYRSAERMTIQGEAAAVMAAHLAATALGYSVWWVTATGLQNIPDGIAGVLDIPSELSVCDVMCFGPAEGPTYKRWKKDVTEILSWDRFDRANLLSDIEVSDWLTSMPVDAFGSGPPPERQARRG